jgi:hypothetical protein
VTSFEQARTAWATAPRDAELDRWQDLYDAAVPRPRDCPAVAVCESCAAVAGLSVQEADTPVGVICLTLCADCTGAERTPRLSAPDAVRRAMVHEQHTRRVAGVAS